MIQIREVFTHMETIFHEYGPAPATPLIRGAIMAVLTNPFAGRYEPDLLPMMDALKPVGLDMARRLLKAMHVDAKSIQSYGKGAIVGAAGELEHGAVWHVPGGYAMRELLEGEGVPTKAIVISAKKVGAPSTRLDIPLGHVNASYVRSHFDAMEVSVPGAPAADEVVFVLAMTTGARIHARVGGLSVDEIAGQDGLR